jgi:ATP-dependent helicase/nuclease subunit A
MSSSRTADAASRDTIRTALDVNILVEAGAGSGKTQMLAERMAAGVASGAYRIEHMAAVTFTRKAASELRGRFQGALEKLLQEDGEGAPLDSEGVARVRSALSNLERFFAGTIHAFCARLLRERPVESGVAPGFSELDEVQDLDLRRRAWRDFIASTRSAGDPDMLALLATGVRPGDLDGAFETLCLHEDVEFPPGDGQAPDVGPAKASLQAFWAGLQRLLPHRIADEAKCKFLQKAVAFRTQMRTAAHHLDEPAVLADLLATWDCESTITMKWWADTRQEGSRLRDAVAVLHGDFLAATVQPFLKAWRQYVYRLAVGLLTRARSDATQERRRRNVLNYADLLTMSARVLRENHQVRQALQRKYRHLFVDEFQDTDPVQAEIIFLLAAAEDDGSESSPDWREVTLRPGALFVVGDPKQSIYRFRRADIDIYNAVRERIAQSANGRVLPLTMNFRSARGLCEWANAVFGTRFPAEPTPHAPQYAPLDAHQEDDAGRVLTLTYACPKAEVPEEDARRIASYIRAEVDAGRRTFSDFLVLARRKRYIGIYARALEALNVPVEASGAGAFGQSPEVATVTALLRALADPQDPLPLIAVLRGPLFGISDPELFAYRQSGGWFGLFGGDDGKEPDPVRSALAAMRQFYRWTRVLPAPAALERVLEATGYLALASTTPDGVDAGDLVHAVDRVRQVVEDGGSLADAADALEADSEAASEVESLPLEPGRSDVVRVMNLHKAKGLEAPVVFLADPCGGWAPKPELHIQRQGATARGWFPIVRRSEQSFAETVLGTHPDWPLHAAAEEPYLRAEEDRLLYVAATRARDVLVVSRWVGGNLSTPAWGVLNGFLGSCDELVVPPAPAVLPVAPADTSEAARAAADAARSAAFDTVRAPSWSITSVTSDADHIRRMVRPEEPDADDPTQVVRKDTPSHRADAGQAWGSLIHALLEHAMRHPAATRDDLRRLAMWLTVQEPQLRTVLDQALDTVEAAARGDFWQKARAGEHSAEAPFLVEGKSGALTTGVIDLLFESGGRWEFVDYKTDVDLVPTAYAQQLEAYSAALEKFGCSVLLASIVSVRASSAAVHSPDLEPRRPY